MQFNLSNMFKEDFGESYLREHEKYLEVILDSVQAGVVVIDSTTHKITEANPAAVKMIGASKEEIISSCCYKYFCSANQGCCPITDLGQCMDNSEGILSGESGKKLNIIKTVTKIMIRGQEYLLESFIDITEKKKLEVQLRYAQKMKAVGTLAGGITHDFSNILQIISGNVQLMLMEKKSNHPDCKILGNIEKSVQRAHTFIKQLLIYSKKVETEVKTVDLNQELLSILTLFERTLLKAIHIELDLSENIKAIKIDPSQLEQIIVNLAINARDAMPDGGTLTFQTKNKILNEEFCRAYSGAKPGEYVLLNVSDSGYGMDEETLEHIFEPFFTTKEMEQGTGLGLAMVYGIVKNHQGYIICDSFQDSGTVFKIYFPVAAHKYMKTIKEKNE